jgi:hypothetical protein
MSLVTRTPLALETGHRDLPNRVMTSFTPVGDEADRVAAADVRDLGREARPTPVRLGQQQHWMSLP